MAVLITGNTFNYRKELKDMGGKWDATAKGWWIPDGAKEAADQLMGENKTEGGVPAKRASWWEGATWLSVAHEVGAVFLLEGKPVVATVVKEHEEMVDGVGQGILYAHWLRAATKEEAKAFEEREQAKWQGAGKIKAAKQRLAELAELAMAKGDIGVGGQMPDGERFWLEQTEGRKKGWTILEGQVVYYEQAFYQGTQEATFSLSGKTGMATELRQLARLLAE